MKVLKRILLVEDDPILEECYQLVANAYVVKPVRFHEFIEAVRQVGVFWALINEPPPGYSKR